MALRLSANSYNSNTIISSTRKTRNSTHHQINFFKKSLKKHPSLNRVQNISSKISSTNPQVIAVEENINSSSETLAPAVSSSWLDFAKNVSGEWDGYGADFSVQGKPMELPEQVVPEAYREWEVKVFDWQTQCPTLAQTQDYSLLYKLIKLLPTVGCEADAATRYTIDERRIGGGEDSSLVSAFAYNSSGCYVAVWPIKNQSILELEHCLVDPENRESRVRVVQVVCVEENKLVLEKIKVFCEQWYGPFRNGDQLGGCSIRDSAFASTDALKGSEVSGVWQGLHSVAYFGNSQNLLQEVQGEDARKSTRDENGLVLLPKQLWCSLKGGENGETYCEVGWLLKQGSAMSSKCVFSPETGLKEIAIGRETAVTA